MASILHKITLQQFSKISLDLWGPLANASEHASEPERAIRQAVCVGLNIITSHTVRDIESVLGLTTTCTANGVTCND